MYLAYTALAFLFLCYTLWKLVIQPIPKPKIAEFLSELRQQSDHLKVISVAQIRQRNCKGDPHIQLQIGELKVDYWRCTTKTDEVKERIRFLTPDRHCRIEIIFLDSLPFCWSSDLCDKKVLGLKSSQAASEILEEVQKGIAYQNN